MSHLSSIGDNYCHQIDVPLPKALKKRISAQILPFVGLLLVAPLVACESSHIVETVEETPPPSAAGPEATDSDCSQQGKLQTNLFGSLETSVSWTGSEMLCENMLRPNGNGMRLRFAGDIGGERLVFIIAIPGIERGKSAVELPSNVTTTVEGSGRFFSTPNLDVCWTDVSSQVLLPEAPDTYVLSGTLYCVAPLGEINGEAAVSIPELTFTTLVRWSES